MRIMNITCEMQDSSLTKTAVARLEEKGYEIELCQYGTSDVDSNEKLFIEAVEKLKECALVIIRVHAGLTYFKKFDRLKEKIIEFGVPLVILSELPEDITENRYLFNGPEDNYISIRSYLELGGSENEYNLFAWLLREIENVEIEVAEPRRLPAQGYYLPGKGDVSNIPHKDKNIAILFNQNNLVNNNLAHIDALIKEIESRNVGVIPIYLTPNPNKITGSIGINETIRKYLCGDLKNTIGAAVLVLPFSQLCLSDPGDGSVKEVTNIFAELGVPVIQAITMFSNQEDWKANSSGLGPYELSMSIFWPEYDGQIISVPLSSSECDESGRYVNMPIEDRVKAIADLSINWTELKFTPVNKRKIAVILHQNPPRADMIGGAFGLDAAESTSRLLRMMRRRGYGTGNMPSTGKGLTKRLLDGVSNDSEWLSSEDMMERCAAKISLSQYKEWLSKIDSECADKMVSDWGSAPGEINTVDDITIIPGFIEGNIFVGLQPNRGLTSDCVDIYHSQDVTPPHSYLAFYKWVTEEFGAQAIIHMGCHGTLEWLPGKGTGLSSTCYPDIVFGHLPHIYPYAMSNPGEGMHAKRRNGAIIVDHLIPPLMRAGNYDELIDIESKVQEYLRARSSSSKDKMTRIADDALRECLKISILDDIGLSKDCSLAEFEEHIDTLYDYICEVKDNLIKNGLHILGNVPAKEKMDQMIYSLVRTRNGNVPSLRATIAEIRGYNIDKLSSSPSTIDSSGKTYSEILDSIDFECINLIEKIRESDFDALKSISIAKEMFDSDLLNPIVTAICETYVPNLKQTTDELKNIMDSLDGRYILPGPSGCISRGNAHLLPSGRNFYSIDPASIPTQSSWEIGVTMANQMIDRFVSENGTYPKQVGIVIWATDTMKTGGDDIAYIFHMLGVKPIWSSNGGAVVGLEIISTSELGRPRIDVTMRISGLFRDSFPNLVEMMDDAIEKISELDESDEDNFLLAHLRKDITESIAEGMDPLVARRKARVRIFGDPPGNYGGGVDSLIGSSQWGDKEDLAEAYVEWGGYAYGKGLNGDDMKDFFRKRMSEVDVTIKNHESRELDAFDNDDDYVFLGGMNATVEVCKGEKPLSLMGDSSDPSNTKLRSLAEEGKFIYRSRVLNPKWIDGLKEHGYRGVQEITNLVEFTFGWDSTSDIVEDWMYQSVTDKFVLSEENREWIEENNPDALRQITSRLLEAVERGMWAADEETVEALKSIFLDNESALEKINDR